jgi:hypothetical protein
MGMGEAPHPDGQSRSDQASGPITPQKSNVTAPRNDAASRIRHLCGLCVLCGAEPSHPSCPFARFVVEPFLMPFSDDTASRSGENP